MPQARAAPTERMVGNPETLQKRPWGKLAGHRSDATKRLDGGDS
jgi:hypothetical protein